MGRLEGGDGNDILEGGAGADILNGGAGIDRAVYTDSPYRLVVNLYDSTLNKADAAGDQPVERRSGTGGVRSES